MGTAAGIATLQNEMTWLETIIGQVITSYFLQEGHERDWLDIEAPDLSASVDAYAVMANKWELDVFARLALALSIAPHFRPEILDIFFGKNQVYDRGFSEFGGVVDKNHSGFLPTGQTFCFLVSAVHPELRMNAMGVFDNNSILMKEQVLLPGETEPGMPSLSGLLGLNKKWFHYFLTGIEMQEENTASFPAQKITTNMDWEDVVLDSNVYEQVMEIKTWMQYGETLMNEWQLNKKIKPGYRALFYGPPGTGKTLTATLLGKAAGCDVYKIDLSLIVSKYIGETEKNLSGIFDIARYKNWILFFDEADALFGKRTATSSSNDRFANQQTAYLLQRIEDFPGVVILASNLKANMDDAFSRRFQSVIHFDIPGTEERYLLWKNAFSGTCTLHPEIDLHKIAEEYELAGGAIINILRNCALAAVRRSDTVASKQELMQALRRELKKENRMIGTMN
ncbi:MAG: ATP-binding protein [Chitinophagaceae bacterium]|nr:ATP-binding protein [Chitinophagaceae bacterium]